MKWKIRKEKNESRSDEKKKREDVFQKRLSTSLHLSDSFFLLTVYQTLSIGILV
jgi:hypothetical protein